MRNICHEDIYWVKLRTTPELSKIVSPSDMFSVNFTKCFRIATMRNTYDRQILSVHQRVSIFNALVFGCNPFLTNAPILYHRGYKIGTLARNGLSWYEYSLCEILNFLSLTSQNGQTYPNNSSAIADKLFECV